MKKHSILYALTAMAFFLLPDLSHAQLTKDSVKAIFARISSGYDSAKSIRFDVTLKISSDTVKGISENDVTKVNYIIDGSKMYYANSLATYVQDDSLSLTIMTQEKMMYLTPKVQNTGFYPASTFDSNFINQIAKYQAFENILPDGTHELLMTTDSTDQKYSRIAVRWEPTYNFLISTELDYKEFASGMELFTFDGSSIIPPTEPPVLNKHIVLSFENYQLNEDDSVFDLTQYFYYDAGKGEFIAKGKYAGFQLLSSNVNPETNQN